MATGGLTVAAYLDAIGSRYPGAVLTRSKTMSSQTQPAKVDENKLNQFIGQMLGDLGGASSVAMVRLGSSLGLYETLHANGPMTSSQLAKAAKVHERYLREWLSHQAASNYLAYDAKTETFSVPPEQAMVFVTRIARSTCGAVST